jgi:4-amino-4-deoxy-L-arabinose transferase-like glycosyltransferase
MKLPRFLEIFLFLVIIGLGVFLRFYKLGEIPNGFYVDEATVGYNAYSILKTGKDEYGKFLPLTFRFFGSYSPPLYVYLTAASINFFGLSIFATRLTSVVSGVLMILIVYFLLKSLKIFKDRYSPILGTFLFAVSPWAVFFSRVGYEINLGFTLLLLGILFFWLGLSRQKYLIISLISLSLSTYGAHSERFLVPVFLPLALFVFRKILFSDKYRKSTFWGILAAVLIQIPNLYLLTTPAFNTKAGLFFQDALMIQSQKTARILPFIISYPLNFIREFFSRFLTCFSPRTLFSLEDPDLQRSIPTLSLFYSWMAIPYFVGWYRLIKWKSDLFKNFLFLILFSFPIAVSLTKDPFSSQRGIHLLLPLIIIITLGLDLIIYRWQKIGFLVFCLLSLLSLVYLWRGYFVLLPYERARVWEYGYQALAEEIQRRPDKTFVIDQARTKPSYIELAFFLKYSPEKLQKTVDPDIAKNYYSNINFSNDYKFANIETRGISWKEDPCRDLILVGDEFSVSPGQVKEHFLSQVFEIKDPVGMIVFRGFKTNPKQKCL